MGRALSKLYRIHSALRHMEIDSAGGAGPSEPPANAHVAVGKKPATGAPKKLVIKAFKEKPKLPENFEADTWAKLQAAVRAVHAKEAVSFSYEQLYRGCEDLVLHKLGAGLYAKLMAEVDAHVGAQLQLLAADATPDVVAFLARVDATWQDHTAAMHTLRSIFLVLDRSYVLPQPGVRPLWEAGLATLRTHLSARPALASRTVRGLLAAVERERGGEGPAARPLLKSLLRLLSALGMYGEWFEKPFLEASASFYAADAARALSECDVPSYLRHAEGRLAEEAERCGAYLDTPTRRPLLAAVERALVASHLQALLDKGFAPLMSEGRVPDLARLYALAGRVGAHDVLRTALSSYVKATGKRLVTDADKDGEMVTQLLELKARMDAVLRDAFAGSDSFANALKDAFETFINERANRPAELVAKYIDSLLKAGNKGTSDEELEALLDRVLILFRYISGKDVFEAFYKKDLAKRLLLGKSASIDAEKSMIAKLKAECGAAFTTKLEGMFKDVETSKDVGLAFRGATAARDLPAGMEVAVSVLTAGFWPTYPPAEVTLPAEIAACTELFTTFYLGKHSGRRLVWQHGLGQCVLKARFAAGVRELQVSLFQAAVLLLFNDAPQVSLEDIKAATGIEDKELRRTLQSLACGKVRVLNKTPRGKEVDDGDSFDVNDALNEPRFRIKINAIQMRETPEEAAVTNEKVFQDRQYQIDAAIVRIMKTRKTLTHVALVNELMTQLKFEARREDLKKRIESLIEREYLERDKANNATYNYLA